MTFDVSKLKLCGYYAMKTVDVFACSTCGGKTLKLFHKLNA